MDERNGSDDVDLFVGGVDPDPDSLIETSRLIAANKQRPDYQAKLEEARKILADAGIDPNTYGMLDARSLLDLWHRCIADLAGNGALRPHAEHLDEKMIASE